MKTVAIVQARMSSSRLPGKVLRPLGGVPAIDRLLDRLTRATRVDEIIVATSDHASDEPLVQHLQLRGTRVIRGPLDDVLARYAKAAREARADTIIRITGDCPLNDPEILDAVVALYQEGAVDYASNVDPASFPDGMDVEVFSMSALDRADRQAKDPAQREHVTQFIRNDPAVRRANYANTKDQSHIRLTLDDPADYTLLDQLFKRIENPLTIRCDDIIQILQTGDGVDLSNQSTRRNMGAKMGKGQKLWTRAKGVIPGGSMLLSKRAEQFLPDFWPAYFSKAKGCKVWDLDGTELTDMSLMAVGTNTLGYGHDEVDAAVIATVQAGNMSTLNNPEEVALAEKLVELHPWFDMVRFARSGGEANAIAVRIARAASGKNKVAVCGYHGWHDWYLSANLRDTSNLDAHLLPGLEANGVPKELAGLTKPFQYNDIGALEKIMAAGDVGVIKMEVKRNVDPAPGFLERVRELADTHGAVLIFDECTSGFRETYGGLHIAYDVRPDIAVFGKTLGNGYAITAVVGRRDVMEGAQSTFISSTFWTERIGPSAALKTLDVMAREKSWEEITRLGQRTVAGWHRLAEAHGLTVDTPGLPSIAALVFHSENNLAYKTYIAQEMLKKGYLATTAFYASIAHTDAIIDRYLEELDPVFAQLSKCEAGGDDIMKLLEGPVVHSGFKRLN